IGCAWRSVGPTLRVWMPGHDASSTGIEYEGVEQDILAAEVVQGKAFLDVDYLLVLCTISEVSLHAIHVVQQNGAQRTLIGGGSSAASSTRPRSSLHVTRTKYSIPTDGVRMLRVAGDPRTKRIFLGGEDGGI
ncbi:unnamed protein product, partial [Amoebophrya sp. A25]